MDREGTGVLRTEHCEFVARKETMNFQSLETRLNEACAKINAMDPANREAVGALYEVTFNLFRNCLKLEDRLNAWEKSVPLTTDCECKPSQKEPSLEIMGVVPPDIIIKAMEVEMWMKRNGHFNWSLGGIQSVRTK